MQPIESRFFEKKIEYVEDDKYVHLKTNTDNTYIIIQIPKEIARKVPRLSDTDFYTSKYDYNANMYALRYIHYNDFNFAGVDNDTINAISKHLSYPEALQRLGDISDIFLDLDKEFLENKKLSPEIFKFLNAAENLLLSQVVQAGTLFIAFCLKKFYSVDTMSNFLGSSPSEIEFWMSDKK